MALLDNLNSPLQATLWQRGLHTLVYSCARYFYIKQRYSELVMDGGYVGGDHWPITTDFLNVDNLAKSGFLS